MEGQATPRGPKFVCRGSIMLGSACGHCDKCKEERARIGAAIASYDKKFAQGPVADAPSLPEIWKGHAEVWREEWVFSYELMEAMRVCEQNQELWGFLDAHTKFAKRMTERYEAKAKEPEG